MSTLAGWFGDHLTDDAVLQRMAEVMSGPAPLVESHRGQGFAVTTVRPSVAGGGACIAATPDASVVLGVCGYLHAEDPEVQRNPAPHCLDLYLKLGSLFAQQLNGSYAIAVCDHRSGQLLLVTDRLATRALYYSAQKDFVFGSEVKAVLQYPGISRKLNQDRLREFLAIACVPGWETYYDHIRQVPSASVLAWDGESPQISRYWEPQFEWNPKADIGDLAADAVETMRGAVRRSCIGGQRLGLMLSGGLDSRTIAASAERPLLCMTMHRQECYEVRTARQVAEVTGHEHCFVHLDRSFPLELLREGSIIGDGMHLFANAQALAMWGVLRERGIDRLLNGWSMDVHFSGLCLPAKTMNLGVMELSLPALADIGESDLATNFVAAHRTGSLPALDALLRACSGRDLLSATEDRLRRVAGDLPASVRDAYDAVDWLELLGNSTKQADYLNVLAMDRLTPAAIPAHDNQMVDGFLHTPPAYRFNQRIYLEMYSRFDRHLRRIDYTSLGGPLSRSIWWNWARKQSGRIQRELIVPGFRRLLRLPPSTRYPGSWPQAGSAMRNCQEWHTALWRYADESRLVDLGIVRPEGVRQLIGEHLGRIRNHATLLSSWLTLEEWVSTYG
jgi:asparagine synthetase B (glutamine-hydrolysing)